MDIRFVNTVANHQSLRQESKLDNRIQQAAERLRAAQKTGQPCAAVRDLIGADDVDSAYAVQSINVDHRVSNGGRVVGRKIGLTAQAVQKQLGVNQPDFGMLFEDMQSNEGDEIPFELLMQPRIEAEIAFVLSTPLLKPRNSVEDIIQATDYVVAAFEIVESRIDKWDIKIADTVADNASSGRFVLGSQRKRINEVDLINCRMILERDGKEASSGVGSACLGNPLAATAWLADMMVKYGRPLQAGDVVLSGALGPMVPIGPGDVFETRIDGLGTVRASFGKRR